MGTVRFGPVLTAMATPFTDDGELDLDGAVTLARWLLDHGSDGLVLAGTTGESPTLSDEGEKRALWDAVREAVDAPLVAGSGSNDTRRAIDLSEQAAAAGMDGLLVVTPYYNKPPQTALEAHFRAVAGATSLPIVIYDIPGRTGRKVDTAVLARLGREVPTIAGVKDASGNPAESARLIAATPEDFCVWSGDDPMTLPLLAVGAVGVIGTSTHWCGEIMSEMIAAFGKGDHERARELNASMFDSYRFQSRETAQFAQAVKAVLRCRGLPAGPCRPPLTPDPPELAREAQAIVEGLGLA